VAKDGGDKKAQAFARYALVRFRLLQGESAANCQGEGSEVARLLKELDEKKHAGSVLLLLAQNSISSSFSGKSSSALRFASEALALFDQQADKASAHITLAEAHMASCNYDEAILATGKALPLLQGDVDREASTMILAAKAHLMKKEFIQAEASANSAAQKGSSNRGLAASAKGVLAESLLARGQDNGKEVAREALELAKASRDAVLEAYLRQLLAKHLLASDPLEALDLARKAMAIHLLKGESKHEAVATHTAAKAHLALRDYDSALQLSLQAVCIANGIGDSVLEASALHTASQARVSNGQIGEALLAARKSAELFHSIGDKEGEKVVASAINKIQDKMPPPHRPTNVLMTSNPAAGPTNLVTQARHCVVWNQPCKEGAYINYALELIRLIDDVSKSTTMTPLIVCSSGSMGRLLGTPVPGQQKDINSMSVWGVVRTVRLEMPRLPLIACDLPSDADGSEMARVICDATDNAGPRNEVAYAKVAGDGKELLQKLGRDS
jgi:tetratricopeptide (TPR) repeat protein